MKGGRYLGGKIFYPPIPTKYLIIILYKNYNFFNNGGKNSEYAFSVDVKNAIKVGFGPNWFDLSHVNRVNKGWAISTNIPPPPVKIYFGRLLTFHNLTTVYGNSVN